jgi:uncharacterized radical SAM protein YgiQ
MSREEMHVRGWEELDFVLVSGDAYVDHPSFGAAIISRLLASRGYRIGIIAQPDWKNVESFRQLGRPRLAFLITAGNLDSMVNHFSVSKHRRKIDAYSPGGLSGRRPDRALLVYCTCARQAFKNVSIVVGGLEASLRRFSHYDYWSNSVRRSVLLDSKADLLVYGMGERQVLEIARLLDQGTPVREITCVRGTAFRRSILEGLDVKDAVYLPSFDQVRENRRTFSKSFRIQYEKSDPVTASVMIEPCGNSFVVQNPPAISLSSGELDEVYELPYTRSYHPAYESAGGVPALQEVRFSLTSSRGCFGGCSFCSLSFHQGRVVQARSHASLLREACTLTRLPGFKGSIHDVGGPTANFRHPACSRQLQVGTCRDRSCLFPRPCRNLHVDHRDYVDLLRSLRLVKGVKKVFVRSGIRYDYVIADPDETFLQELCLHHISGQLKVAPEHVSREVLSLMGKPGIEVFERFERRYTEINRRIGKKQYLVPYLLSSHPGADLHAAVELAEYLRDRGFIPEQVQDFYPTPGTLSTCMYWTGQDPRSQKPVYVARSLHEKALQRALIHYRNPANHALVKEALIRAGRTDLIGYSQKCLIRPHPSRNSSRG